MTAPYNEDEPAIRCRGDVAMFVYGPHVPGNSRPLPEFSTLPEDILLDWDGRLDSRDEIGEQLPATFRALATDAELVQAAYRQWGIDCFRRLVGDWALAIWDLGHQQLVLARDFVGVRQLYFDRQTGYVSWCTVLDPLLYLRGSSPKICREYLVAYLSTLPHGHLTPFMGISSVGAGTFVVIDTQKHSARTYWNHDPSLRTQYSTDAEYEERFRSTFRQAVRRRLRSDGPVFAELSGGMDSSSIVCMADGVIREDHVSASRLETISYYDESEPNWDESPYYSLVEQQRGQSGHHLDLGTIPGFLQQPDDADRCLLPGRDRFSVELQRLISKCMPSDRKSVLLSGLGGDEFLGGVPNPLPELQDLLVQFQGAEFLRSLSKWSLSKRRPWIQLCFEVTEEFLPQIVRRRYRQPRVPPWLARPLRKEYRDVLEAQMKPVSLRAGLPSFQANVNTLDYISRQLNCYAPSRGTRFNLAYPYLDRDLLEFLFSIPRSQILRAHQRRSLMKRALSGLVPSAILNRRRKAYVARSPIKALQGSLPTLRALFRPSVASAHGIIDDSAFLAATQRVLRGETDWLSPLITTVRLEHWLRGLILTSSIQASEPTGEGRPTGRQGAPDDLAQLSTITIERR